MKSIRHIESSLRNAEASHKFAKLLKCVSFQPVISTETASKDNNARVLTTLLYTCEDDIQETFEAAGNICSPEISWAYSWYTLEDAYEWDCYPAK